MTSELRLESSDMQMTCLSSICSFIQCGSKGFKLRHHALNIAESMDSYVVNLTCYLFCIKNKKTAILKDAFPFFEHELYQTI